MGGEVEYIVISDLRNDVFFARIVMGAGGKRLEIDSRPSDALALAVRLHVPVYIEETVMDKAAVLPEEEMETETAAGEETRLDAFKDFVDSLDLEDLEGDEGEDDK